MVRPGLTLASAAALTAAALALGCAATDRDDSDSEVPVTIDQLPPDARAALEREAAGAAITEIDRETAGGRTIYSADVLRGGEKWEIEIAEDGTVLSNAPDREDDGED